MFWCHHIRSASLYQILTWCLSFNWLCFGVIMLHIVFLPGVSTLWYGFVLVSSCYTWFSYLLSSYHGMALFWCHHVTPGFPTCCQHTVVWLCFGIIVLHLVFLPVVIIPWYGFVLVSSCHTWFSYLLSAHRGMALFWYHHVTPGFPTCCHHTMVWLCFGVIMSPLVFLPVVSTPWYGFVLVSSCHTWFSYLLSSYHGMALFWCHHVTPGFPTCCQHTVVWLCLGIIVLHLVFLPGVSTP